MTRRFRLPAIRSTSLNPEPTILMPSSPRYSITILRLRTVSWFFSMLLFRSCLALACRPGRQRPQGDSSVFIHNSAMLLFSRIHSCHVILDPITLFCVSFDFTQFCCTSFMSFVQSNSSLTVDYTISMNRCLLCIDVPAPPSALAIHRKPGFVPRSVYCTNRECLFRFCAEFYRVVDMIPVCNSMYANCLTAVDCISMALSFSEASRRRLMEGDTGPGNFRLLSTRDHTRGVNRCCSLQRRLCTSNERISITKYIIRCATDTRIRGKVSHRQEGSLRIGIARLDRW